MLYLLQESRLRASQATNVLIVGTSPQRRATERRTILFQATSECCKNTKPRKTATSLAGARQFEAAGKTVVGKETKTWPERNAQKRSRCKSCSKQVRDVSSHCPDEITYLLRPTTKLSSRKARGRPRRGHDRQWRP